MTPRRPDSAPAIHDSFVVSADGAVRAQRTLSFSSPVLGHLDVGMGTGEEAQQLTERMMEMYHQSNEARLNRGETIIIGTRQGAMLAMGDLGSPTLEPHSLAMGVGGVFGLVGDEFLAGPSGSAWTSPETSPGTARMSRPGEVLEVSGDGTIMSPKDL